MAYTTKYLRVILAFKDAVKKKGGGKESWQFIKGNNDNKVGRKNMATCDICGKIIDMPFKCSYCNGVFCEEHHIPEFHYCKSPRDSRFKPPLNPQQKMTGDKERRNLPLFQYDYQQLKPLRIKYAKDRISKKSILGILFFLAFVAFILIYVIKILLKM